MFACGKGRLDIVKKLLDRGADPDYINNSNETAAGLASKAENNSKAILKLLNKTGQK